MGITARWFDESKTIILFTVEDPWTWEENHRVTGESFELIETVEGVVDYIVDVRRASLGPRHVFTNFRRMIQQTHPREGLKYMVGVNHFGQMVAQVFRRINPGAGADYIFVDSIEAALERIQAARQHEPSG